MSHVFCLRWRAALMMVCAFYCIVLISDRGFQLSRQPAPLSARINESFGKIPMSFEVNQGQTDSQVKFLSRGPGYGLFLTPTEAVLSLNKSRLKKPAGSPSLADSSEVLRMKIDGGNERPTLSGVDEIATKSHYLLADASVAPIVDHYAKVKYEGVYPGIDLIWYGTQQQLEYDWIVAPGSNPDSIRLSFSGVEQVSIAANGDLVLKASGGELRQPRPQIYQEKNSQRRLIDGGYVITGMNQVGFEIKDYDLSQPLIIDPLLYYSTYLGGSGNSSSETVMTLDRSGNVYVAGITASLNFPVVNAGQPLFGGFGSDGIGDGFISKLNPDGSSLLFSTYLGGSRDDEIFAITLGSDGSIFVGGDTSSLNFPLKNPLQSAFSTAQSDSYHGFLAKITADGSALVYSTYLGGNGFEDLVDGLAVDADGNAYVSGYTNSTNFPSVNALQAAYQGGDADGFVAKINPAGSAFLFSSYLGGGGLDEGFKLALDESGVYVMGLTQSLNFPTKNAFQATYGGTGIDSLGDGFVTKISLDGSAIIYSTYLGGSADDEIFSMALGSDHSVYLAGDTSSLNFPLRNPLQSSFSTVFADSYHCFITKLNPDGATLAYSTYLGGGDDDAAVGIAVDPTGCAYITGETASTDFPLVAPIQSSYRGGNLDSFIAKINPTGSALLFSTYFGGSNDDLGADIRVDSIGNIFVAGLTTSIDIPTRNAFQSINRGNTNLFIAKLGADEVTVGGANFSGATLTPKGIASAFGPALANATAPAPSIPLPTALAGTTIKVTDSTGVERLAPLFYVSPGQVNYQIPAGTVAGPAFVLITSGDGTISTGAMQINQVALSIFTLNQSGSGAAAALDAITFLGAPFNAKRSSGEPNIIAFYGTGLGADATDIDGDVSASMQATIDGQPATLLYAGRAPGYVGLNQLNLLLPASVTSGIHSITFTRNGVASNTTTIEIK